MVWPQAWFEEWTKLNYRSTGISLRTMRYNRVKRDWLYHEKLFPDICNLFKKIIKNCRPLGQFRHQNQESCLQFKAGLSCLQIQAVTNFTHDFVNFLFLDKSISSHFLSTFPSALRSIFWRRTPQVLFVHWFRINRTANTIRVGGCLGDRRSGWGHRIKK